MFKGQFTSIGLYNSKILQGKQGIWHGCVTNPARLEKATAFGPFRQLRGGKISVK
jgi:hypothetical protein